MPTQEAKEFLDAKERALAALATACEVKEVDDKILPVLTQINSLPGYYTLSSCAGRILLLQIPQLGDKHHAVFLGRWHQPTTLEAVKAAAAQATTGVLWVLGQSPILHIGADSLTGAERLVKAGNAAGFKNSAIRSLGKRVIVEVASTERLDAPIGKDGILFCNEDYLFLLVDLGNEILRRSEDKLSRFTRHLGTLIQL